MTDRAASSTVSGDAPAEMQLRDHYEDFHEMRFAYVMRKSRQICPKASSHVLDIGRHYLTLELLRYYENVTTLGVDLGPKSVIDRLELVGSRDRLRDHIFYNLNDAQTGTAVGTDETFDLIIFAEVIEHLYTAPELTLLVLRNLLKPGGHMILQTPNAAALHKRMRLLFGANPYEKIRSDTMNPGHFREYTKKELIDYALALDMRVVEHEYTEYFAWGEVFGGRLTHFLYNALLAIAPDLARGQTIVLQRNS